VGSIAAFMLFFKQENETGEYQHDTPMDEIYQAAS